MLTACVSVSRFSQTTHDNEYKRSLVRLQLVCLLSSLLPPLQGGNLMFPTKPDLNKSVGAIKTPGKSNAITLR